MGGKGTHPNPIYSCTPTCVIEDETNPKRGWKWGIQPHNYGERASPSPIFHGSPTKIGRQGAAYVVDDKRGYIYALGGTMGIYREMGNTIERYDIKQKQWTDMSRYPYYWKLPHY